MAETLCAFPDRDEALVSYMYGEMDDRARATFDAHLAICVRCRSEVTELADVRRRLTHWEPPPVQLPRPAVDAAVTVLDTRGADAGAAARTPGPWWKTVPAWVQAAAAMLVLGASVGLANLDIHYDQQGLSIRTGWLRRAPASPAPPSETATAPWHADLVVLEQELRKEFHGAPAAAAAIQPATAASARAMSDAEILRRLRALVDESDKRQERELALRVAEVMNNVRAQRNADLLKIDRSLGLIQNNTAAELMKQRGTINYLVSTTQK
jgi:Putative zinc-finger